MHEDIICDQNYHYIRDQHSEKRTPKNPIAVTLYVVLSGSHFPDFWVIDLTSEVTI